jgi:hypothetical protein
VTLGRADVLFIVRKIISRVIPWLGHSVTDDVNSVSVTTECFNWFLCC